MERSKLEIPKLEKNSGTGKWRTAAVFDNWQDDARDILQVMGLDSAARDAMIWLGWHLEGDAKILHSSFRKNPATSALGMDDFLIELRKYCISSINQDDLWSEFQSIKQTQNGRTRPIQHVANKIKQMQILLPKISDWQCYQQLLESMDGGLLNKVRAQINEEMEWSQIVKICEIHDSIQHKFRSGNSNQKPKNSQKMRQHTSAPQQTHSNPGPSSSFSKPAYQ
jgi:hypothetical protein